MYEAYIHVHVHVHVHMHFYSLSCFLFLFHSYMYIRIFKVYALHKLWRFGLSSWAALVAQLVECSPSTQNVAGSNPARGSSFFLSRKKGVVFGRSCLLCLVSLNEFTCTCNTTRTHIYMYIHAHFCSPSYFLFPFQHVLANFYFPVPVLLLYMLCTHV